MYCNNCGTIGKAKTRTKSSFLIEIFLWFMLIVPGIVYSLWRLTSREKLRNVRTLIEDLRRGASP